VLLHARHRLRHRPRDPIRFSHEGDSGEVHGLAASPNHRRRSRRVRRREHAGPGQPGAVCSRTQDPRPCRLRAASNLRDALLQGSEARGRREHHRAPFASDFPPPRECCRVLGGLAEGLSQRGGFGGWRGVRGYGHSGGLVVPTRCCEQFGVLLDDAGVAGCVDGWGRRGVGEENRDDAAATEDFSGGGEFMAADATVEGGLLRRRNEASSVESVRGFPSRVLVGQVANQRLPRGETSERTGTVLA